MSFSAGREIAAEVRGKDRTGWLWKADQRMGKDDVIETMDEERR